jgi:hypothetical protein
LRIALPEDHNKKTRAFSKSFLGNVLVLRFNNTPLGASKYPVLKKPAFLSFTIPFPIRKENLFLERIAMFKTIICPVLLFIFTCTPNTLFAEQVLTATKVNNSPQIDGKQDDPEWEKARTLITQDEIANIDLKIKCVYTDTNINFLISYPDTDESRSHKPWTWNPQKETYEMGPQREDCFVLKWALDNRMDVDLSVRSDNPYMADIWFWKACRTDPAGFADDKIQTLSPFSLPKSKPIISKSGHTMHLQRLGDQGQPAYRSFATLEYQGPIIPQFEKQMPTGSRADIKAKGQWLDGRWTIEFARPLTTGMRDDVQFDPSKKYVFGASRFEVAGRAPQPHLTQPLYGAGDVSETLYLVFEK